MQINRGKVLLYFIMFLSLCVVMFKYLAIPRLSFIDQQKQTVNNKSQELTSIKRLVGNINIKKNTIKKSLAIWIKKEIKILNLKKYLKNITSVNQASPELISLELRKVPIQKLLPFIQLISKQSSLKIHTIKLERQTIGMLFAVTISKIS